MNLFTIAPHTPFLRCLAGAIMDGRLLSAWDRSSPFWLSDVTVIVPTQRARQALADAFADHPDFPGLLPDIRTLGGEDREEEPFLPPFDAPPLPPTASPLRRRLILSRLVAGWAQSERGGLAFSTPPTAAEIFSMADSLGTLIDDLLIEERDASDIRAIGDELGPELGEYWQQTLGFLDIALAAWPQMLVARGMADAIANQRELTDRQAAMAERRFGQRPVIAAGSTGSIAATARLLGAIARLPRGAVVLPGLDVDMSEASRALLAQPETNPHGHPQYGLARLLRMLGVSGADVVELCQDEHPRIRIVNHALALTTQTALWPELRPSAEDAAAGLAGVSILAARNEDEEARAIALAARAALAAKKSVGIITPDQNLARRIAAELQRFDILVDDAAGTPLFHSPAGRLARQVLNLVTGQCNPVDLVALLRNRAAHFGLGRETVSRLAGRIDMGLLRGQRPAPGMAGLRALLATHMAGGMKHAAIKLGDDDEAAISDLLARIETAIGPLRAALAAPQIDAATLADALCAAVEAVSVDAPLHGGEELGKWAAEVASMAGEGHRFAPNRLEDVLATLMMGFDVRNRTERRKDIAIWGQIEARLMSPDVMILGALNEDKWPATADPGPWLSRGMRLAAGLEPPERLQGLAAHDFVQALGNETTLIAYADRIGSSPALPSRLVQRLDAFVGKDASEAMRRRGQRWLDDARRLDAVATTRPASRPAPNPPVDKRPRQLSVTEIETLMRSPYDLYARHTLGLRRLDALGEDPDARERGNIIHAILARFVIEGHDPVADTALDTLMDIARDAFSGLEAIGERRDIWLRRFETAAGQFLAFERERNGRVRKRHAEIDGRWSLKLAEPFTVKGRADRVDEMVDGTLELLDFKTGSPPSGASMKAFEAPQLLVEALMARNGGMAPVPAAPAGALTYIKIGLGPDAFKPSNFSTREDMTLAEAADEIGRRLQGHVELFLMRQTPLHARLLPLKTQRFAGAYDHLARVAEWSMAEGEDEA